jgi:Rrf2 family protein
LGFAVDDMMEPMQVSAKVDYAVRALLEVATSDSSRITRDELSEAQEIPPRYLEVVLNDLRRAGLLLGHRGSSGGYSLGRPADMITVADVARAVDGPLALVQGRRPEDVKYSGSSVHLHELWIGLRAAVRSVLEAVTIADLASGYLPPAVRSLVDDGDAWLPH